MSMQTLKKSMREKSKALKDLSKQVKGKSDENRELDRKLRELQVSVAERAQIERLAGQCTPTREGGSSNLALSPTRRGPIRGQP